MPKTPDTREELAKAWRLLTSPWRKRPAFLLPGAPKAGTSSLHDALCAHPAVVRGRRKEPTNLIHHPGSERRARMNYPFVWDGRGICGDASVEYWSHPDAPAAARDLLPEARIIVLLRDPVERAWSDYRMFRRAGCDREEFTATVERAAGWLADGATGPLCEAALRHSYNPLRYVRCGMYADLLETWWRHFPREQTLVLLSEEFFAAPQAGTDRAWRHLGLEPVPLPRVPRERDSGETDPVPSRAREVLEKFYAPRNRRLAELLGRSLPWS
jgi:hypothetical protein